MGLNGRGRSRGRKFCRGGSMPGSIPTFHGAPGMCGPMQPPVSFYPGPPQFGTPVLPGQSKSGCGGRRPSRYGKFPRRNFRGRTQIQNNFQETEIDITKPWVSEDIKLEEEKRQEHLNLWRNTKDDADWNRYKEQNGIVQNLFNKAKSDYLTKKPEERILWCSSTPSVASFYCEACDKTFKDERALYLHKNEHETCGRDGCQFSAHPKLVAKHIKMQHETGLYHRIGNLKTEEDIVKWIAERKRKYPTRKVVEEKKAVEEEKTKHGERLKPDESKFNKSFTRKERSRMKTFERKSMKDKKKWFEKKAKRKRRTMNQEQTVAEALKEESSWRGSVPPFTGIGLLYKEEKGEKVEDEVKIKEERFSDEEWETTATSTPNLMVKTKCSSLGMLATYYNTEDEVSDGDGAPLEVKTVCVKKSMTPPPEDVKDERQCEKNVERNRGGRRKMNRKRRRGTNECENECNVNPNEKRTKQRELTLLEKLLSAEIRHERNVILQCVRYVVENNFFLP